MFKKLVSKKRLNNEKGLTLIELLAVIVILAIIAAIAIPAIGNIINKSKDRAILAEASNILAGAKIAYTDGACNADGVCNAEALKPFVDGIELPSDTSATLDKDKKWTISYSKLGDIKLRDEFNPGGKIKLSETELNQLLKKEKTTSDKGNAS